MTSLCPHRSEKVMRDPLVRIDDAFQVNSATINVFLEDREDFRWVGGVDDCRIFRLVVDN